jgi:hypothetical protein
VSLFGAVGIPIARAASPRFVQDREPSGLSHKGKGGVLSDPAREGDFIFSMESLLWLPVSIELILLMLFFPDDRVL